MFENQRQLQRVCLLSFGRECKKLLFWVVHLDLIEENTSRLLTCLSCVCVCVRSVLQWCCWSIHTHLFSCKSQPQEKSNVSVTSSPSHWFHLCLHLKNNRMEGREIFISSSFCGCSPSSPLSLSLSHFALSLSISSSSSQTFWPWDEGVASQTRNDETIDSECHQPNVRQQRGRRQEEV